MSRFWPSLPLVRITVGRGSAGPSGRKNHTGRCVLPYGTLARTAAGEHSRVKVSQALRPAR
ncbi:hypothetical protein SAVIM40S_04291 [Streptomyces avidinii]